MMNRIENIIGSTRIASLPDDFSEICVFLARSERRLLIYPRDFIKVIYRTALMGDKFRTTINTQAVDQSMPFVFVSLEAEKVLEESKTLEDAFPTRSLEAACILFSQDGREAAESELGTDIFLILFF